METKEIGNALLTLKYELERTLELVITIEQNAVSGNLSSRQTGALKHRAILLKNELTNIKKVYASGLRQAFKEP